MVIQVKVKPSAKSDSFELQSDGTWLAQIKAPPVDGKANERLVAIIAKHFRVPKLHVSIKTGASSKIKRVQIDL